MNKFLVIGGTHGNEPLGIDVCKRLERINLPYLDVLFANELAIKKNRRFLKEDLNRVFPGKNRGSYEIQRAKFIVDLCKSYDYVIDFHNTYCPDNDCGFVGGENYMKTLKLACYLGLKRIIIANYNCINEYVNGCLSVEISLDSRKFNVDYWVKKMIGLNRFDSTKMYGKPNLYRFSYRITRDQQNKFNFPKWPAFRKIPSNDLKALDIKGSFYPIFIDDRYTPYNYAGLIKKLL